MLSLGVWFLAAIVVIGFRTCRDRGSREAFMWRRIHEDYIEYVSMLDRKYLVRDWVGRIMRGRARTRAFVLTFSHLVVVLLAMACVSWFDVSPVLWLMPVATWLGLMPAMGVVVLRQSGYAGLEFGRKQWAVILTGALLGVVAVWGALVLLFHAAFLSDAFSWRYALLVTVAVVSMWGASRLDDALFKLALRSVSQPSFGAAASRDSILYLRSFNDDKNRMYAPIDRGFLPALFGGGKSLEAIIADVMQGEGELVAIGRPGERLPEIGAVRSYWPDDEWQDAVRVTAVRAQAIVMLAGSSTGLGWEVEHLRKWGLLSKTLFVLPPVVGDAADSRVEGLLRDLDVPEAELGVFDDLSISTVAALRIDSQGRLVVHTVNGRDWANYMGALWCFIRDMDGGMPRPEPGELSRLNGYG